MARREQVEREATKRKAIRNMTRDEQIAFVDGLIDRDAELWKRWIRESEYGLSEFLSRSSDSIILRPVQR
jgi:hypothetical protein